MRIAILLSVRPRHLANILNGDKINELRKSCPRCYCPIDVYLYCTNDREKLLYNRKKGWFVSTELNCNFVDGERREPYNGKIVGVFELHDVEEYYCEFHEEPLFAEDTCYQGIRLVERDEDYPEDDELIDYIDLHATNEDGENDKEVYYGSLFLKECCLTLNQIKEYAGKTETLYGWRIEYLEVYISHPKELSDFYTISKSDYKIGKETFEVEQHHCLTRGPQSWQYVGVKDEN